MTSASSATRRVSQVELRTFLLDRLGLRGPLWQPAAAADRARDLGMWQIDSIRVTGLRNHELAWVARAEEPATGFYDLLYKHGAFRETHYPLFAVRRDWLPLLLTGFSDFRPRHKTGRRRYLPLMQKIKDHIRAHGPVTVADFESKRVVGGFNTIKSTTKALDYLFYDREIQIVGRTPNFHRVFDLTERCDPHLLGWSPPAAAAYERFLIHSALCVLKIDTAERIAGRVALHYGSWRGESIKRWRALVAAKLPEVARAVVVADLPDSPVFWYLPEDETGWDRAATASEPLLRVVPPLDQLLFSRGRFSQLFGFDYKFEAYTPADQRRFYFAKPLVFGSEVVGLVDAKLDRSGKKTTWQIAGLELMRSVPPDALRQGLQRVARQAGADHIRVMARASRTAKSALNGPLGNRESS
ncbi:MAG: hypothetical protein ACKVOI_07680 [Dongiaceae bacterium]